MCARNCRFMNLSNEICIVYIYMNRVENLIQKYTLLRLSVLYSEVHGTCILENPSFVHSLVYLQTV